MPGTDQSLHPIKACVAPESSPHCVCCLPLLIADVVVMLNRNLEFCSYGSTALFGTDDFDELEQQFNKVRHKCNEADSSEGALTGRELPVPHGLAYGYGFNTSKRVHRHRPHAGGGVRSGNA